MSSVKGLFRSAAIIGIAATLAGSAHATVLVKYDFSGSISGSTYTEAGGTPGTASVNFDENSAAPVMSGGIITTTNNTGSDEGLFASTASAIDLATTQFISEARVKPTGAQSGEGDVMENYGWNLAFSGTNLFGGYYDGAAYLNATVPNAIGGVVPTDAFTHIAAVYTLPAGGGSKMDVYVNGAFAATISSGAAYSGALPTLVGLLNLDRAPNNRGFDGSVDAVALSTFTGAFNTNQFVLPVPEPASLSLLALSSLMMLKRRR